MWKLFVKNAIKRSLLEKIVAYAYSKGIQYLLKNKMTEETYNKIIRTGDRIVESSQAFLVVAKQLLEAHKDKKLTKDEIAKIGASIEVAVIKAWSKGKSTPKS